MPNYAIALVLIGVAVASSVAGLLIVERVPPSSPVAHDAERLAAQLRTRVDATGDEATLRARVAANLTDLDARLQLGRVLAARGKYDDALAELLEVVRRDPHFADDAARKAMLDRC